MELSLLQDFAFPVALVIVLGGYIAQTQKINREDNLKREETYRTDSLHREQQLMHELGEMSATNKMLLETNAILAREINAKLDKLLHGGE